jgi:UDP-N-acetylglucosamine--N-acetylmuramyl-(pentapeptide) pyrophosphoryl-undecaprenol N-acetylglucosamine transferase
VFDARALVARLSQRAVFSIGGYAAGPISIAARTLSVPVALMEPNSAIGLANRLVAPFVRRAYTAFPESDRHFPAGTVLRTGAPIRAGFSPSPYAWSGNLRVLVLGGSQGAASLNDAVPRALSRTRVGLSVVHQCGAGKDAAVRALYEELGASHRARVVTFIDDMPTALAQADLVIGRAGAGAVAEICAVGRPSILVPYPFAGDHQKDNALSLERAGAAVCIPTKDATPERLADELERLTERDDTLAVMANRARALGRPTAAHEIATDFLALAGVAPVTSGNPDSDGRGVESGPSGGSLAASARDGGAPHV